MYTFKRIQQTAAYYIKMVRVLYEVYTWGGATSTDKIGKGCFDVKRRKIPLSFMCFKWPY